MLEVRFHVVRRASTASRPFGWQELTFVYDQDVALNAAEARKVDGTG